MNLSFEERSYNGHHMTPLDTRMFTRRRVFLESEITFNDVTDIYQQLAYLSGTDSTTPIRLFINSYGGSHAAGLAIIDLIRDCPAPVEMFCLGQADGIAAVIFASGKHGRYMTRSATLRLSIPKAAGRSGATMLPIIQPVPAGMPIPGLTASAAAKTADNSRKPIGFLNPDMERPSVPKTESPANTKLKPTPEERRLNSQVKQILADATGRSVSQIAQSMRKPRTFTAEQAIRFGLCDAISNSDIYKEDC